MPIPVNPSVNDELDLELIEISLSCLYIDLFSNILFIISTQKSKELIIQRIMQSQQNQQQTESQQEVQHPTPTEIDAIASCLGIYTILIYTRISIIRLNELYKNIQEGTTDFTLGPNINITVGFLYSIIGNLLRTIGVIQRVKEEAEITIL
ncbi:hypothetical protein CLPUN_31070 [Clostridium puniceum]|uniref:DUF2975 domain-containing protein n=1 Tax=Clostridium puniceum TaxID=29367 RepID=A0A1S8TDQ1_9CLOT|nr:hypothetical protein [Clostridium puniceum]OOM75752.1 hypothetical protein CLPUN_31070 [Clostridium puniceum]